MLSATALFLAASFLQLDGYRADRVETLAWILGACAEGLLVLGGYLGGAIVFVYGVRALGSPNTPPAKALGLRAADQAQRGAPKPETVPVLTGEAGRVSAARSRARGADGSPESDVSHVAFCDFERCPKTGSEVAMTNLEYQI
jgi:hypothetical protein